MYKAPEKLIIGGSEWHVRAILDGETSQNNERQFISTVYHEYVSLRRAIGGNRCTKMRFSEVASKLSDATTLESIKRSLKLSNEQIETILYVAENHIRMVK